MIKKTFLLCALLLTAVAGYSPLYSQLFEVTAVESRPATQPMPFKAENRHKRVAIQSRQQYIEVTKGKKSVKINPTPPPEASMYIWVSLSPNGKYILYNVPLKGTFVCTLKGDIVAEIGRLNAPVWYDNDIVIGMDDYDDGNNFTSSDIVAVDVHTLERQVLSTEKIALYPYPEKPVVHYFTLDKSITIQLKKI